MFASSHRFSLYDGSFSDLRCGLGTFQPSGTRLHPSCGLVLDRGSHGVPGRVPTSRALASDGRLGRCRPVRPVDFVAALTEKRRPTA